MSWLDFSPLAELAAPVARREPGAVSLLGLGAALPSRVVSNDEVAGRLGLADGWIERRTGIEERRVLAEGETLTGLAVEAAEAALADAGVRACEIDVVLAATTGGDEVLPNLGPVLAHAIGARHAGAMDVGAACTGFLSALPLAAGLVESGRARHVLVVGADALSRFVDPDDRVVAPLFGDGAGAVVVGAGDGSLGPVILGADGGEGDAVWIPRDRARIVMDGHRTFQLAVAHLVDVAEQATRAAGVRLSELDLVVLHQANRRILRAVAERLGLADDVVVDAIGAVGNTSAASLPLALAQARDEGRLQPGSKVLLGAVGSGFTWGGTVVTWA